jgi:predicted SAM-dependent methyltransferase
VIDDIETVSGIRLNIGCGLSPTPGWVNFDNSLSVRLAHRRAISHALLRLGLLGEGSARLSEMARHGSVRFADASARIPCASGSVGAVYSSHMIEHLDRSEARSFLAEVRRVLWPGGVLRIAAPDLSLLVRDYVATGDADGFVAGTHLGLSRPAGLRERVKWTLVGPRHHLWMYDGESLTRLLGESGFKDAAVAAAGTTRIAEPGQLDLREREAESVYVEATRPL